MPVEQKIKRLKIVCGYLLFFLLIFQKLYSPWGPCSIWDYILELKDGQGLDGDANTYLQFFTLVPALLTNILYFVRSILLQKNKLPKFFGYLSGIGLGTYAISMQPYFLINLVLVIFDFMFARWLEERDRINAAYEIQKAKEKAEKAEKKRIRYFPGRYPAEFFQIIRKNMVYERKGLNILRAGCFLSGTCIYTMLSMYVLTSQIHGKEDLVTGSGLVQIFQQAGLLIVVFNILMLTLIISYYIKDKKKSNHLLVILGMRSRTVYLMFAIIFGWNAFLAGMAGMAGGFVTSYIVRGICQSSLKHGGVPITLASVISGRTIAISFLVYVIVLLLALGLNQENILNLAKSDEMNKEVQKEKRKKKFALLLIAIGVVLFMIAMCWLRSRNWAETLYIHILSSIGILLILIGSVTCFLNRLECNKDKYYCKIIENRPFYYRYWKSIWNLFYLSIIHFFVLSVFVVQFNGAAIKQDVPGMFPYDIVCTAYEADLNQIYQNAEEHHAEVHTYPMFRMTSLYGSDKLNPWFGQRPIQWPQGQHIAISESTYDQLNEYLGKVPEKLNLDGKEVHIVYQQDLSVKAHTIDWDTNRVNKHLRIGQPLSYYNTANFERIFPIWDVKSEERDILTGTFYQGMQDNLIVFNDSYFEEAYQQVSDYNKKQWTLREDASFQDWRFYALYNTSNMTEGPTQLICLNVPDEERDGMMQSMRFLEDKYQYDRMWDDSIQQFYEKRQMIINTETEILFRKIVYAFVILLLLVMGFFQYYVKFESEMRELNWQNIFLKNLGMREKDRKKALAGQMKKFVILPLVIGICGGAAFSILTIKARLYTTTEMIRFLGAESFIYLLYVGVWIVWYLWIKKMVWKQAEVEK